MIYNNKDGLIITVIGKVPAKSSSRRIITNPKTKRPMIISSAESLAYEKDFQRQITGPMMMQLGSEGRLTVSLTVFAPNKRQDIDSFPKIILDCLQKNAVIYNDNRIDELLVFRKIDKENPRVIIQIWVT